MARKKRKHEKLPPGDPKRQREEAQKRLMSLVPSAESPPAPREMPPRTWMWAKHPYARENTPNQFVNTRAEPGQTVVPYQNQSNGAVIFEFPDFLTDRDGWVLFHRYYRPREQDLAVIARHFPGLDPGDADWTAIQAKLVLAGWSAQDLQDMESQTVIALLDKLDQKGNRPRAESADIGQRMKWQMAQERAEAHVRAHNGEFPTLARLAAIIGCSRPTLAKAVMKSSYLRARQAEAEARRQKHREVALSERHLEDVSEAASRDAALDRLVAEQRDDEERDKRRTVASRRR